ncbi:alpha,alpha-phosphotrehalase [Utexia brackfieldae]|uniref:alpha,alpha-phosphotrehalase n=1 Tax=Utexia brackfieldae TaxID=3074108 RepID=UPI00370D2AE6
MTKQFSQPLSPSSSPAWWKTGVVYQIYPKSFQDTTGNGMGDIQGIIQRLDYLAELGVAAIWLTPIYLSPQIDNGYDIADYYQLNPDYGTMADFDELVAKAHQRNIRIMMDMVLNHTSTEHPWFKSSLDKQSPYRSFYIWRDGKADGGLPNNWQSKFSGPAWQWHPESQQYYLHLFAVQQADLNWENPQVRDEVKQVCQFWIDKGVDALRLDVMNLASKQQDFPDDDQGDGRRFYTDGPRIHEFLQELSRDVFQPNQTATVGEMSSTTLAHCQQYACLTGQELSMVFNFHHLKVDYPQGNKWTVANPDFIELKKIFKTWQQGMHNQAWSALFWCNHDQPRIVSRFGHEQQYHTASAKMLAMVLHGMQGTPYIYQGEEIGMLNPHFSEIEQYRDIESLNIYDHLLAEGVPEAHIMAILAQKSRDNSRTPMQWDSSQYAGFSVNTPWIEIGKTAKQINVANALADKHSTFYCYQRLIKLRQQYAIFTCGDFTELSPNSQDIWHYRRQFEETTLQVIANLTDQPQLYCLADYCQLGDWQTLYRNYPDTLSLTDKIVLKPYEAHYLYRETQH